MAIAPGSVFKILTAAALLESGVDPEEIEELKKLTDQNATLESIDVTRTYEGHLEVVFPEGLFPEKLHPNAIDGLCDSLPVAPDGLGPAFRDVAVRCRDEIRSLAHDGRLSEGLVL